MRTTAISVHSLVTAASAAAMRTCKWDRLAEMQVASTPAPCLDDLNRCFTSEARQAAKGEQSGGEGKAANGCPGLPQGVALTDRQWLLSRRPDGRLRPDIFTLQPQPEPGPPLAPGEVEVALRLFLCAPTMRNWMDPPGNSLYPSTPLSAHQSELCTMAGICPDHRCHIYQAVCPREADAPLIVSTAHKAKGREFATVFVLDDFDLPSELVKRRRKDPAQLHETKQLIKLLYVACTRATDRLYLSDALFKELW